MPCGDLNMLFYFPQRKINADATEMLNKRGKERKYIVDKMKRIYAW